MKKNQKLFNHAQLAIPGGVNSPVRAFKSVGGTPLFFQRGKGPLVWDADGNSYIDYVGSWGPLICGHAHPDVVRAVQQAAEHPGFHSYQMRSSFGAHEARPGRLR